MIVKCACGSNDVTLQADNSVGSIVRVCRKCLAKIDAGEALKDIYDFIWRQDENGIHVAHKDDKSASEGCKAREDTSA